MGALHGFEEQHQQLMWLMSLLLLDAPDRQLWEGVDICPRTCPSEDATLCTYVRWFARPAGLRQPGPLVMQPLSARCMRTLLRFRMGSHSLPIVLGRRTGVPRAQRLCQRCNLHAVHDERHLVFECPAMQCVRDRYPALFSPAKNTMQLFMQQRNIVGVALYIKIVLRCLVPSMMLLMMRKPHLHQPWRLDRCKPFFIFFF